MSRRPGRGARDEFDDTTVVDRLLAALDTSEAEVVDRVVAAVEAGDPAVVERVLAGLAANDPPMLALVGEGRGWWPLAVTAEGLSVHRHGRTVTVPWSAVELDV